LTAAPARYGVPEHLRSDNRPEFIAACMQDWLEAQEIKTLYIKPASPWENGYIESFHDKLRDECLNRELFGNLREARLSWRVGGSNTINVARTARLATEPRTSMSGPNGPI
jgi:transposase InsO family protein